MGVSVIYLEFPIFKSAMLILGTVLLTYYGLAALKRGYNHAAIRVSLDKLQNENSSISPAKLILLALSFSLLNPQAILDTTLIIGNSANQYENITKYYFVLGAMAASFLWFFSVAAATSLLGRKIMNVRFWSLLEYMSGILMLVFAIYFFQVL